MKKVAVKLYSQFHLIFLCYCNMCYITLLCPYFIYYNILLYPRCLKTIGKLAFIVKYFVNWKQFLWIPKLNRCNAKMSFWRDFLLACIPSCTFVCFYYYLLDAVMNKWNKELWTDLRDTELNCVYSSNKMHQLGDWLSGGFGLSFEVGSGLFFMVWLFIGDFFSFPKYFHILN